MAGRWFPPIVWTHNMHCGPSSLGHYERETARYCSFPSPRREVEKELRESASQERALGRQSDALWKAIRRAGSERVRKAEGRHLLEKSWEQVLKWLIVQGRAAGGKTARSFVPGLKPVTEMNKKQRGPITRK